MSKETLFYFGWGSCSSVSISTEQRNFLLCWSSKVRFVGVCCPIDLISKNIGFNCSMKKVYKNCILSLLVIALKSLPQRQANCLSHSWSLLEWQLGSVQLKIWCFDLKCARSFSIGQSVKSKTKFEESLHCHYSKLFAN